MRVFAAILSALIAATYASACSCLPEDEGPDYCASTYILYGKTLSNECIACTDCEIGLTLAQFEILWPIRQPDGSSLEAGDMIDVRVALSGCRGYECCHPCASRHLALVANVAMQYVRACQSLYEGYSARAAGVYVAAAPGLTWQRCRGSAAGRMQ